MCMRPCVPYYDLRTWDSLPSTGKQLTAIQDDSGQEVAVKCCKFWSWPQQVAVRVLWQVSTHASVHSIHMRGTLRSQLFLFLLASKIASCRRLIAPVVWVAAQNAGTLNRLRFASPSLSGNIVYISIYVCVGKKPNIFLKPYVSVTAGSSVGSLISPKRRLGSWIKITSTIKLMGTRICGSFGTRCLTRSHTTRKCIVIYHHLSPSKLE